MDISAVREIVRVQEITEVPGAADFVLGVINLRGQIISVVDLSHQLGLGTTEIGRKSRILVIQFDEFTLGFLVDAATAVKKLPLEAIEPPPEMIGEVNVEYLEGVAKSDGRLALLLSLSRVLADGKAAAEAQSAVFMEDPDNLDRN